MRCSDMVKVAWVSRHKPLVKQIEELTKKLKKIEVFVFDKTYRDADEVYSDIVKAGCKYAVLVLPLSMIAKLIKHKDITWLWAEMVPIHSCNLNKCKEFNPESDVWLPTKNNLGRHLRFNKFRKIKKVELIFEEW